MLRAVPKRLFSWDFSLLGQGGEVVAEILFASWRKRGAVVVSGLEHRIHRQALRGPFILENPDGSQAGFAEKASKFRREFTVRYGEKRYVLKAISAFSRRFGLFYENNLTGLIIPESWFSRRAKVELEDSMPPLLQAFLVWLTLFMWKRESDDGNPAVVCP